MKAVNTLFLFSAILVAFVAKSEIVQAVDFGDIYEASKNNSISVKSILQGIKEEGITGLTCNIDTKRESAELAVASGMKIVGASAEIDFLNPCSGQESELIARAAELKAPLLILKFKRINEYYQDKEISSAITIVRSLSIKAKERGIKVAVYDVADCLSPLSRKKFLKRFLGECDDLYLVIDSGQFSKAINAVDEFSDFEKRLAFVRIAPRSKETLGNAEILRMLMRIGYDGPILIGGIANEQIFAGIKSMNHFIKTRLVSPDYARPQLLDVRQRAANTLKYSYLPNRFFEKVRDGRMAIGGYVSMTDPQVAWAAGVSGLDFIWIDMEHNAMTVKDLSNMQIALDGLGCASLVRVRSSDFNHLKPILDVGIDGVIVPQVQSYAEAVRVVEACRYPQAGGKRGICVARQAGFGRIGIWDYMRKSETWPMIIIELEDDNAIADLDRILELKDVDAIMIGPSDLACTRSGLNEAQGDEMQLRLDDIAQRVRSRGKLFFGLGSFERALERKAGIFSGDGDLSKLVGSWRSMKEKLESMIEANSQK